MNRPEAPAPLSLITTQPKDPSYRKRPSYAASTGKSSPRPPPCLRTPSRTREPESRSRIGSGPSSLYSLLAGLSVGDDRETLSPGALPWENVSSPGKPACKRPSQATGPIMRGRAGHIASKPREPSALQPSLPFSPHFAQSLHCALAQLQRGHAPRRPSATPLQPFAHRGHKPSGPQSTTSALSSPAHSPRLGGRSGRLSSQGADTPASLRSAGDCMFAMELDDHVRR